MVSQDESPTGAPPEPLVFGPDYLEELELRDGRRLRLRPLRPDDKASLVEAFERLSPESRYRRFFTAKDRLTDAELRYFTEVDGIDHFALGLAEIAEGGGDGPGVGIGRFVRLANEPEVAEPAIAVVDAMHGNGLGRLLMLRLCAAAAERDIRWFHAEFLADNTPMRELLAGLSDDVVFTGEGSVVTCRMRLPNVPPDHPADQPAPPSAVTRLLELVATRLVEFRHRLQELTEELTEGDKSRE